MNKISRYNHNFINDIKMVILMPNLKGKNPPRNMTFDTMEKAKAFFFA